MLTISQGDLDRLSKRYHELNNKFQEDHLLLKLLEQDLKIFGEMIKSHDKAIRNLERFMWTTFGAIIIIEVVFKVVTAISGRQ